jgi:hypothetical protein
MASIVVSIEPKAVINITSVQTSLRILCVLCASAVNEQVNRKGAEAQRRRGAEDAEDTQRIIL